MSINDDSKILLTKEAIKELRDELKILIEVKRPEVIQEIKDARAQGDLSENAEYDAARDKQALIEDRILEIETTLENAQEIKAYKKDIVSIGSIVVLKNKFSNEKETYSIVSTYETDPFENKISNKSPLATALIGKTKGDVVMVEAPIKYEVEILDIK
ncbi:MAG: transcription elongation factor GreA [Mycoplasmataceae bacterium]|nr:transcription elongation factor GreA [Mycoplasmataceae bacterium]MBR3259602.1 transcription elongation factor GreA [Mycoplasmataceae bacterium]MBR3571072.1 transcription elongation factor GreA [Mycoplasmataceae bacterium]MBR4025795.1 transcription elongation factor GreA [Mycoplasmataceae bacterium]